MLKIIFDEKVKCFAAGDQPTESILANGGMGRREGGYRMLEPEEVLYVMDARGAECLSAQTKKRMRFNDVASRFSKERKFMARYFAYRDWRDRGLMISRPASQHGTATTTKKYPLAQTRVRASGLTGVFFPEDLATIVDDNDKGKRIYEENWLGQYGTYKLGTRGEINKLDVYETLFLLDNGKLKVSNASRREILESASDRRKDFEKLYDVYRDWRGKGYVVKTGFKFGTHFRIYFPGAQPQSKMDEWSHSKHVMHVFPRDAKLLTSDLARVIRVAHSVRKTFILAIPGKAARRGQGIDFVLNGRSEDGKESRPEYGMLALGEEEYVSGEALSSAIRDAKERGLELVVAIADRETAVTYYRAKRVELPRSNYEYYEIDWMQP
jgi:tRNA-intron lyase